MSQAPMVDAATYEADRKRVAPLRALDDRKAADRLFWEAQRALRIERNPLGIGRKVEPGKIDIERLVLSGALTTKAQDGRPEFRESVWPTETDR